MFIGVEYDFPPHYRSINIQNYKFYWIGLYLK